MATAPSTIVNTDVLDDVLLGLEDLIENKVLEFLNVFTKSGKKKTYTYPDDAKKQHAVDTFKNNTTIIDGAKADATTKNTTSLTNSPKIRKKKLESEIKTAIDEYLATQITAVNSVAAYNSTVAPVVTAPGAVVVTALATATPITATGTPIVAPVTTSSDSPYEIILDTDIMKLLVYNLFAHDLAHDLFPSGTGLKRVVELSTASDNPDRTTWFNSPHGGGKTYTNNNYKEKQFLDDDDDSKNDTADINKKEIAEFNTEITNETLYNKTEPIDNTLVETDLLKKKNELNELIETNKETNNENEIKNKIKEIEDIKTAIIINKTREFSIDVVKSAGITLEQKGMLWINKNQSRLKRENITDKLFLIIDVDTIMNDFIGIPNKNIASANLNEIYLKNPMYPGYIYFDNYIIHPYDITVTRSGGVRKQNDTSFNLTFTTTNFDKKNTEHTISFSPYLNEFNIVFDEKNIFKKICYYDEKCEINFKDAYNSVATNNNDVNAYEFFSSIFNNYINVEISDDMDSYFYFLYPKFLLKHHKDTTIQKFKELSTNINKNIIDKYINFYREPFKCFQTKICEYLQKKQKDFYTKYGDVDEEDEPIFLFPKNIQNCTNTDFFLFTLSKMFAHMIITQQNETQNETQIFKNINEIIQEYKLKLPKFELEADENKPTSIVVDPEYISFLKLVLLNYPTVSKPQIPLQSGGGVNDNYSKNAARIISTSVASIMYYLDKVTVPTNNIINTEIAICQNIVNKQQASNIDDKLFDDFYTWVNMTQYDGDLKYYNNNVATSLPLVSFLKKATKIVTTSSSTSEVTATATAEKIPAYSSDTIVGLPDVDFWGWLEIKKPDNYDKNLFFINNAASPPNELPSERLKKSYLLKWFTKDRINAQNNDSKVDSLTVLQLNNMIAAVGAGTDTKEKANLTLRTSYESFDPQPPATIPPPDNKFWFCPFSSIMDGQPTCNKFLSRGDIKEKGTLYVTVRNFKSTAAGAPTNDPNEMIYTIKIEPQTGFENKLSGVHKVLVHVLLKIGGVKIIDYGTIDSKGVAAAATAATGATGAVTTDEQLPSDPAIEIDLDTSSYLDAKECMIRLIDLNIGLLKNHAGNARPWEQLITKLKANNTTSSSSVADKMKFKLHTQGTVSTYTNAEYTSEQLRQRILRTSVIKSLGDYSQELNMVTKNSGYVDGPTTIPRFKSNANKNAPIKTESAVGEALTSIRKPDDIRLGLSVDRPSGVRLVLLKLFGKYNKTNRDKSGTNPRSIVGYYDTLGKAMIAYDKSAFPPYTGLTPVGVNNYSADIENKVADYEGGKKIMRKSRKRIKGVTKKRKILLKKNRKISKRNNKGTRKRK